MQKYNKFNKCGHENIFADVSPILLIDYIYIYIYIYIY